ncbi:MAG: GvpL/GvpF family gas vesicle protein [Candidatus Dormibacteraeota bacterium]|nr:GvpL/GvpF family gas vesicle protein [Candidatus Dormibacteraeota bacterium]
MRGDRPLEDVLARALRPEAATLAQAALEEARGEARRLLVERLTRELVDAGIESLEGPPPAVPEPRDTAAAAEPHDPGIGEVGWYLFAVGARGDVDLNDLRGPDGRRAVEAVPEDGLVAFAAPTDLQVLEGLETELPDAEGRLATLARSHDETLRALHERTPVLPMRLATVVRTRQDVEELLRARRPALTSQLEEISGADEWACRVRGTTQPADDSANETGETGGETEAGRAYLSRRSQELRRREERGEWLQASLDRLGDRLEAHATASAPLGAGEPGTVFGAAYLVPREGREAFLETAGAGSEELQAAGAELLVEGPLPPYHFARGDA